MRKIAWGLVAAGLAVAGAVSGAWFAFRDQPATAVSGEADWGDIHELSGLVNQSPVIVVGKLTSEREVAIEMPSPVDGKVHARRVDIVRTVEVQQSLRGSLPAGQMLTVVAVKTASRDLPWGGTLDQGPAESLQLRIGRTYVFFLRPAPSAEYAAANAPAEVWGAPAEPAVAELTGDRLKFLVTKRYTTAAREAGLATASAAVPPSFEVDLGGLRAVIANR